MPWPGQNTTRKATPAWHTVTPTQLRARLEEAKTDATKLDGLAVWVNGLRPHFQRMDLAVAAVLYGLDKHFALLRHQKTTISDLQCEIGAILDSRLLT